MTQDSDFVVVSTAVGEEAEARKLAERIVEERLAACVQYVSVQSTYRWKGAIESTSEYLLLAKTRASLAGELTVLIEKVHSYELPEIIVTPITGGSEKYLKWIGKQTGEDQG